MCNCENNNNCQLNDGQEFIGWPFFNLDFCNRIHEEEPCDGCCLCDHAFCTVMNGEVPGFRPPCFGDPNCHKPCDCQKKIYLLQKDIDALKNDVAKNRANIENNYKYFANLISNLATKEQQDVDNLNNRIDQEIIDRTTADNNEALARLNADDAERERAQAEESRIEAKLDNEIDRATETERQLSNNIQAVDNRLNDALGIDAAGLNELKQILSDSDTATGIIVELARIDTKVDQEINRATTKEGQLHTRIENEIDRSVAADASLDNRKADKVAMAAGTYKLVTVNSQGIVTAGSNPTTVAGYGITDTYTKSEDDALLATKANKVSMTAGDYTKVTVNSEGIVTAGSNPTTIAGYGIVDTYTKSEDDALLATKANKVSMTAGDYTKITVNSEGIVTAGSNPTTIAGYGITNAYTKNEVDALILALSNRITQLEGYWVKTVAGTENNQTVYKLTTPYMIEPLSYR